MLAPGPAVLVEASQRCFPIRDDSLSYLCNYEGFVLLVCSNNFNL